MARNLSVPAIKISDDCLLRNEIVEMYKKKNHNQVNLWAIEILNHVLTLTKINHYDEELIQNGIEICKKWRTETVRAHDIRKIGFEIHRLAKAENDEIKRVALRTIGQAIGSAHMKEHGLVASDYHVKLVNLISNSDKYSIKSTRELQLHWLENT